MLLNKTDSANSPALTVDDMETTLGAAGVKDPAAAAAALAGQDIDWELLTDTFARGTDAVTKLLQSTSLNKPYTNQVTDFSAPTPLVVTTLLTTKSLQLFNHGDEATNNRCQKCDLGGDLLSCSFCNLVYHNKRPCLSEKWVIPEELLNSSYEWPCPECVKNGVRMHQRKQVTPGTTVATGRKRRRGDMGGWK